MMPVDIFQDDAKGDRRQDRIVEGGYPSHSNLPKKQQITPLVGVC
jgi:hypothetical protein